jgi:hypothetical protein
MLASAALSAYWRGLYLCLLKGARYQNLRTALPELEPAACLQIYWLALHVRLWGEPHYRSGTFANDARKNLRNVAIPGTGIPLSLLFYVQPICFLFMWLGVPLVALGAAIVGFVYRGAPLGASFAEALLTPRDWFSYWRLNCVLASYHARKTANPGYALEDKLTFLEAAEREGVPVSPWLRHPKIVVKHRNEEGGLGMNTYSNAAAGGDWIVQGWLANAAPIARLLPSNAPLSTFRFITASRACIRPVRPLMASECVRAGNPPSSTLPNQANLLPPHRCQTSSAHRMTFWSSRRASGRVGRVRARTTRASCSTSTYPRARSRKALRMPIGTSPL